MKTFIKTLIKIICGIAAFALLIAAALAIWNVIALKDFYKISEGTFSVPGVSDPDFDWQGLSLDEESGLFFSVGYMRDKTANPIYITDPETGETIKRVLLLNTDGSSFTVHAGGLTVHGDWVYIAGSVDCCLYVYSRDEILHADNDSAVTCKGIFSTAADNADGIKVSFTADTDDMLFVGEFHMPVLPMYQLRENHHMTIDGTTTSAIMAGFAYDDDAPFGLSSEPSMVICLPDFVQGAVFLIDEQDAGQDAEPAKVPDSGQDTESANVLVSEQNPEETYSLILSKSWFLVPSAISCCNLKQSGSFKLMGTDVPLYTLIETSCISAMPMSEEIELLNGDIYIANELQNFLIQGIGNLWGADRCFKIPADIPD